MTIQERRYRRGPGPRRDRAARDRPAARGVLLVFAVDVLLMVFSIATVLLGQPTLAVIAGTACVSVSTTIARRLLS